MATEMERGEYVKSYLKSRINGSKGESDMTPVFNELSAAEKKQCGHTQQLKSAHLILTTNLRDAVS